MGKNKYLFVLWMLLAITLAGGIFTGIYVKSGNQDGDDGKYRLSLRFIQSILPQKTLWKEAKGWRWKI